MKFLRSLFKPRQEPANQKAESPADGGQQTDQLLAQLQPHKRTAYIPVTEAVGHAHTVDSKMGGYPYVTAGHPWPVCPNCGRHMQLFLQLNMASLPEQKEEGLVQLFYCTSVEPMCDVDGEGWDPFSTVSVCRRIPEVLTESIELEPSISELFPERRIVGWTPVDDYPSYDELQEMGLNIDIDAYSEMEEAEKGIPVAGDKLFGWPHWVQSIEYPFDRKTGSRMELLFQIDSNTNLPHMFGDMGIGHLTRSKDNPNELTFGWACS